MARIIKYLPLTFVAGAWGFAFFMPYLLLFVFAVALTSRMRRLKLASA